MPPADGLSIALAEGSGIIFALFSLLLELIYTFAFQCELNIKTSLHRKRHMICIIIRVLSTKVLSIICSFELQNFTSNKFKFQTRLKLVPCKL